MEHLISVFESLGYKYVQNTHNHFFYRPNQGEWSEYSFVIFKDGNVFRYSIGNSIFFSDGQTDTDLMMREIFSEIKKIGGFETSELRDLQINKIID